LARQTLGGGHYLYFCHYKFIFPEPSQNRLPLGPIVIKIVVVVEIVVNQDDLATAGRFVAILCE
jgi:hypothetical protein